jgi:hypothetical protein
VARGRDPAWSHDGRFVVMLCAPETAIDAERLMLQSYVCAVDVATSDVRKLSEPGASNPAPDPRSGRVVYQTNLMPKVVDRDDEFWKAVEAAKQAGKEIWEVDSGGDENAERDSEGRFRSRVANDLYLVELDGTGTTRLSDDGRTSEPSWTPEGDRVVFRYHAVGQNLGEVWTMAPSGGDRKRAINAAGLIAEDTNDVKLLPGGKLGIFRGLLQEVDAGVGSYVVGNVVMADLFVIPNGGTETRRIANKHSFKGRFAVSPDGKRVAYEHVDKDSAITHIWWTKVPD